MPRSLEFTYGKQSFAREIVKVDRTKLYGSVETETVDADGNACKLLTLASDGKTLIPYGGTAFSYVNPDGEWVDRGDLQPVDMEGEPLKELPSSFDAPTPVAEEVSIETFFDHNVRLVYRLEGETPLPAKMKKKLESGAIFRIPFSYRGGVDPDIAFLLLGERGSLWMLVAQDSAIGFIGLEETALCGRDKIEDDDDEDEAEGDGLSFDML